MAARPALIIGSMVKVMPGCSLRPGAGAAVVKHLRLFVELASDAVAAEFAHHRETVTFGVALDGGADVAEVRAGPHGANPAPHGLVGDLAQAARLDRRRAHVEHAARVAVEAVLDDGDVDVDDVSGLELLVAGNAVTDDVIHRGADRCRVRLIAWRRVVQRRGDRFLDVDHVVVAEPIQLARGHARLDVRRDVVEHFGGERARDAHLGDFFGRFQRYRGHQHGRVEEDWLSFGAVR